MVASVALRALLLDLDAWVSRGEPPPANRIPRRSDGTLVPALPQSEMGFPAIPGVAYNGIHHTGDLWNFGKEVDEGLLPLLPPQLLGTPYPVFVPKTDADGNDIAGIRYPDVAVPIATYTGLGLRAADPRDPVPIVDGCDALGQMIPFAKTKSDRLASGDPRLSLEERYPDHQAYVDRITAAARTLEEERLSCCIRTCSTTSPRGRRHRFPEQRLPRPPSFLAQPEAAPSWLFRRRLQALHELIAKRRVFLRGLEDGRILLDRKPLVGDGLF